MWLRNKELPQWESKPTPETQINTELKPKAEPCLVGQENKALLDVTRYSNFDKLLRVTAMALRIWEIPRRPQHQRFRGPLRAVELQWAEEYWIRFLQRTHYTEELRILKRKEQIPRSSKLYNLDPQLNEDNII